MSAPERIGFVGLGKAGWPMAAQLAGAGHALVVSDADVRVDFIGCVEAGPKSLRLPQELRRSAPTFFFFQISHS